MALTERNRLLLAHELSRPPGESFLEPPADATPELLESVVSILTTSTTEQAIAPKVPFTTRAWIEETVILTPKDSKGAKPEDRQLWVRYDLPGADEGDPDSALTQALNRLAEQTKRVSQP
jgi:hypothetical protein